MSYQADGLLFDLDGTLVDSVPDIAKRIGVPAGQRIDRISTTSISAIVGASMRVSSRYAT